MKKIIGVLLIMLNLVFPLASAKAALTDGRILGMYINPDTDYVNQINIAKTGGAQDIFYGVDWKDIETSPNIYNTTNIDNVDIIHPALGVSTTLAIRPIDTVNKVVPADLINTSWDSQVMISRFNQMIDVVLAHSAALNITTLVIGNEVDSYFGNNLTEWAKYKTFYSAVVQHIKLTHPTLKIGVSATFNGLTSTNIALLQHLNTVSDVVVATYYPLNANFTVKSPSSPLTDLPLLVSTYPSKRIYFQEAGYPSSSALGSSEAMQSAFVANLFTAWSQNKVAIPYICISWLKDLTPAQLAALMKYFGSSDPNLSAYFGSIGVRTSGDVDKQAFVTLKNLTMSK